MPERDKATLLRIFIGESDTYDGKPLHESIVLKARELGIAGATVIRGPLGYGHSSRLHTSKILEISDDLPLVIEIVDKDERIDTLLEHLEPMLGSSLVTLESVQVIRYGLDGGIG